MRIAIDSIPDDGVHVDVHGETPWAIEVASAVLESSAQSLAGHLHVAEQGGAIRVRGDLTASGQSVCERCGEATLLTIHSDLDLSYVPEEHQPTGYAEVRLAPGDLDVGWFSGGVIDLADVMSEALALALPSRIICTDTNSCDQRVDSLLDAQKGSGDDHPFAALRQLT